jgi:hypothetical protein
LRDATGSGDVSSDLPVGVHVASDLSVFENLTSTFRRWRWRHWRRGWRTGAASQQHGKKSQRQHAFPRMVHRTTRDKWKSNFRDRTDHGRPDHSFFIAECLASASERAVSEGYGCRFCVGISEVGRLGFALPDKPPSRGGSLPQLDGVHLQKTGRLSGRLREQARSHSWNEYICKKQVGCQAAFASRLAPTVGLSTPAKNRSAVRPPSRASSLPQLDGVHLQKTGRLSGRLREQARSHSWMEYTCKKQVGCQAAFASRLAPTEEQQQIAIASALHH